MSLEIVISSVTANTPVNIYYCDAMSANCQYVATVAVFPYVFNVPDSATTTDFIIKIEDVQGCELGIDVPISPTPTPSITPSPTLTPTITPTPSSTSANTPTPTPTKTATPSITPSITPTITTTPTIVYHRIGQQAQCSKVNACSDQISVKYLYNYLSAASTSPILGIVLYSTEFNSLLFNPFNGGGQWFLMEWVDGYFAVQISSFGIIEDFVVCGS